MSKNFDCHTQSTLGYRLRSQLAFILLSPTIHSFVKPSAPKPSGEIIKTLEQSTAEIQLLQGRPDVKFST